MKWDDLAATIHYRTSRSSGPGGQHANKTETRVEAVLNLLGNGLLTASERARLRHHLGKKLNPEGQLILVDQSSRSQHANRERVTGRMRETVEKALRPIPKKHVGGPLKANRKKRLDRKKRRGEVKADRGKKWI